MSRDAWRAAERLARQHGNYIERATLLHCGLSSSAITRAIRSGHLTPRYPGVYCLGPEPLEPRLQAWGAILAAGPGAVLHAESALAAFAVLRLWSMPFHLITPHNRHPTGLRVLRARWLAPGDIVRLDRLPVAHPALAILYGADALPGNRLTGAINTLRRYHGLELEHLEQTVKRFPRHPNTPRIRDVLRAGAARDLTFSRKEALWRPFALRHDLPDYTMNEPLPHGRIADVLIHNPPCIIEIDGGLHDITVQQDRARDIEILAATGLPTLRVDPDDIEHRPRLTARRLHAALAALRRRTGYPYS